MLPVLEGLFTIGVVIGVGYLLARIRLLPDATPEVLSRLVFFVATPALLLQTLADASIAAVLSSGLAVTALATTVAAVVFIAVVPVVVASGRRFGGDRWPVVLLCQRGESRYPLGRLRFR